VTYTVEQRGLATAIRTISETYIPRLISNGNRADLRKYSLRLADYGRRLGESLVPPLDERTLARRPTWETPSTVAWTTEQATAGRITGQWLIPAQIARPGCVVTVPGGPLPRPQYGAVPAAAEIARLLRVPVLQWDYEASPALVDPADVLDGIRLARARYGRTVLLSHSFGGTVAGAAAQLTAGPDAFVPVASVLSLELVGESHRAAYRAAGADPAVFRRRLPVVVIAGAADRVPSAAPGPARAYAAAYRDWGGSPRLRIVEGAGADHTGVLYDWAVLDAVAECLG